MKIRRLIALALSPPALAAALALPGCEPAGPAEKAGASVDKAVKNAADSLDTRGPAQKAGDRIDKAVGK